MKEVFCIIKEITQPNGIKLSVIILDTQGEVLEFDDYESAERMSDLFESNSDSGWKYIVKKI